MTQQEIDDYTGTDLETYRSATITIEVKGTASYNSAINVYAYFSVFFESPRTVACKDTTFIVPSIDLIFNRVTLDPVYFTFPELMDTASIALGDATGMNCGTRSYTLQGVESFIF